MTNKEGKNVSAFFGFFRSLLSLLDGYEPGYLAVVMDSRVPTFRHEMYPEYKATREKAPEELHEQVPLIEEVLRAMGIRRISQERYEADDLIATMARLCSAEQRPCYIVSGDKDLLQLVDGHVKMLRPDKGGSYQVIGPAEVEDQLGVRPDQIIDYLSLIGDSADNVPGVRGIGPKTAVKLLTKYKTLDGVYQNIDSCSKGEQSKLLEGRESAYMSRRLVVLHDVENPDQWSAKIEDFQLKNLNRAAAVPLFLREGAKGLAEQAGGEKSPPSQNLSSSMGLSTDGGAGKPQKNTSKVSRKGIYEAIESLDDLDRWIARVKEAGTYSFDCETTSLNEMQARPLGFSLAVKAGEACYIPLIAGGRQVLPEEETREKLRQILEDRELKLVGHNFKYDYKVLRLWGITPRNVFFDTMIAAWLLDSSSSSYGMDALAEKDLDYRTVHYDEVVPKGADFSVVDLAPATNYAAEDADITFRLYESYKDRINGMGMQNLLYRVEMPLMRILAEMELRGIRVLGQRLTEYGKELNRELKAIEREIYREVGYEFNISSTKQLQEVLFVERKLSPVKKTKTGYSTDLQVLELLSQEDIVPQQVLQHRTLSKLKSTYVDSLPQLVDPRTGRIHTRFSQTGTATGRLSSREPNLQNIPIREEAGRRIRRAFVPDEGKLLISADYSQIELVVLAHLSGDDELKSVFQKGGDVHRRTAALIFDVSEDQVSAEQRRIAKTINFGVMYGMSGFRLARELNIPRGKADNFIKAYFQRYSGINSFIQKTVEEAERRGYVETMLGRRREISEINSRNKTEKSGAERIAVNTPIQGTAADIVKLAMIKIDQEIGKRRLPLEMLLQIHDELIFEVPAAEAEEMMDFVRRHMEEAVELSVPLKVSVEIGESWGDLH